MQLQIGKKCKEKGQYSHLEFVWSKGDQNKGNEDILFNFKWI